MWTYPHSTVSGLNREALHGRFSSQMIWIIWPTYDFHFKLSMLKFSICSWISYHALTSTTVPGPWHWCTLPQLTTLILGLKVNETPSQTHSWWGLWKRNERLHANNSWNIAGFVGNCVSRSQRRLNPNVWAHLSYSAHIQVLSRWLYDVWMLTVLVFCNASSMG